MEDGSLAAGPRSGALGSEGAGKWDQEGATADGGRGAREAGGTGKREERRVTAGPGCGSPGARARARAHFRAARARRPARAAGPARGPPPHLLAAAGPGSCVSPPPGS